LEVAEQVIRIAPNRKPISLIVFKLLDNRKVNAIPLRKVRKFGATVSGFNPYPSGWSCMWQANLPQ